MSTCTIQVIRAFFLWFVSCAIAWPVSVFFSQRNPLGSQLLTILLVVGISAAISGFNSISVHTLNRQMKFGLLTLLELVPQFIALTIQLIWAWLYPTVWVLVGGWILSSSLKMFLSHLFNLHKKIPSAGTQLQHASSPLSACGFFSAQSSPSWQIASTASFSASFSLWPN
ncbi:MAG: oligosaccharide flippase family protein [Chthoniobacterales bacterium]|nr:oligosaccharide flippase family protein [Chthoniobacterales bacterium]